MRELNIRYKIGLAIGDYIDTTKIINKGIWCTCLNEHEIYLWGGEMDFETWWNVIIHENFHAVLWANDINAPFHHPIMFLISELIEKCDNHGVI